MFTLLVLVTIVTYGVTPGAAYSGGAPTTACLTMEPSHDAPAQTSPFPYNLAVTGNDPYTVTLSGASAFKGFMLSGRIEHNETSVGIWSITDGPTQLDSHYLDCDGPMTAVTQSNALPKLSLTFTYIAPAGIDPSTVEMEVAVVEEYNTYWTHYHVPLPL